MGNAEPLLPTASECMIQSDNVGQFLPPCLSQQELRVEQLTFGIQVLEVTHHAALLRHIRKIHPLA